MKEKLKKYSPLGLLALAIVAGVVAVSTLAPPKKDAGYDVIGYFACSSSMPGQTLNFVLVASPQLPKQSFVVLSYSGDTHSLVWAGEPEDLSYFSAHNIFDVRVTETRFLWKRWWGFGKSYNELSLNRSNGNLNLTINNRSTEVTADHYYKCDTGEQARNKIWLSAERKWERIRP